MEYLIRHQKGKISSKDPETISDRTDDIAMRSLNHCIGRTLFLTATHLVHVNSTAPKHEDIKMLQPSLQCSQVQKVMPSNFRYG